MGNADKDCSLEYELRDKIFERLNIDYIDKEDVDFDAPIFSSYEGDESEGSGLDLDSVDALDLVVILRNNYNVEVSDEGIKIFKSIRTIADFIRSNKSEQ